MSGHPRTLYALLAGINGYRGPVEPLQGCHNDVGRADALLRSWSTPDGYRPLLLREEQATRAAVIDGFRRHLRRATRGDTALFWFSGHGSQLAVPPRWAHLEPTGRLQTLICYDSRHDGVPDLLDKELAVLIAEVAAGGADVVVVLDACHSGGSTRATPALRPRYQPPPPTLPSLDALLPELLSGGTAGKAPDPDHVLLAACQSREAAYEIGVDGEQFGVFSHALLDELGRQGPGATYRELMTGARCVVEDLVGEQVPVLFPAHGRRADRTVLDGRLRVPATAMTMRYLREHWEIDTGACHGLRADGTRVGVAGSDPVLEAAVVAVGARHSAVAPIGWEPDPEQQYPVVLTRVPMPSTTVALDDSAPARLVAAALAGAGPSPYVRALADPATHPDLRISFTAPGTLRVAGRTYRVEHPRQAEDLVADLEHIARWRQVKALHNPLPSLANTVRLEIVAARPDDFAPPDRPALTPGPGGAICVPYRGTTPPEVFIRLRNTSGRWLYCALLDLTDLYRVHPDLLPGEWIAPGGTAWAGSGAPVELSLPPGRTAEPGARGTDWLKLLIAAAPFNSAPFNLPRLGDPADLTTSRSPAIHGVIDRLGLTTMSRDRDLPPPAAHDWTTSTLTLVTYIEPTGTPRPSP